MSRLPGLLGKLPASTLLLLVVLGLVVLAIPLLSWLNTTPEVMEEITLDSRPTAPKPLEALPLPLLVTTDPAAQPEVAPANLPTTPSEKPSTPRLPNPFVALPGQSPIPAPVTRPTTTPKPTPTPTPPTRPTPTPAPPTTPKPVASPRPAVKVSVLQQFVTNNELRLTGVTVGSVRVAILSSRWGGMVLTQGEYVPGSTVKVSRVESNKVILVQGKETAVLRLGEGE